MKLRVGALFAGYGGIEQALAQVASEHPGVEVELVWYCEVDKAASKIMAHHHPDAINLGDVTKVDWSTVPEVDVICGGSPCQDLSHAGKRAGMKAGTRSGLWASMCDAIDIIRPRLVIWENVRGAYSAEATSAVEPCPICVGDGGRVSLRALGRVLGDLAELGYDARWYGLRAADVGAAHGRFRVFLFATPADCDLSRLQERRDTGSVRAPQVGAPAAVDGDRRELPADGVPGQLRLLPTPTTVEGTGPGSHGTGGDNLRTVVDQLLPTPSAASPDSRRHDRDGRTYSADGYHRPQLGDVIAAQDWREYEAAIRRQEAVFGRPAPMPTEPGAKGQPRLSPAFVEWLMGLPAGHVTDPDIGISRNDQLKALGNGVVPQQCAAALRAFLNDTSMERAP